jgi:hypothetical protein
MKYDPPNHVTLTTPIEAMLKEGSVPVIVSLIVHFYFGIIPVDDILNCSTK